MSSPLSENQSLSPGNGEQSCYLRIAADIQGESRQDGLLHHEPLCHIWIAPDGTIHAQNLTRPLAQILSQMNPNDEAMRIRAQGDSHD